MFNIEYLTFKVFASCLLVLARAQVNFPSSTELKQSKAKNKKKKKKRKGEREEGRGKKTTQTHIGKIGRGQLMQHKLIATCRMLIVGRTSLRVKRCSGPHYPHGAGPALGTVDQTRAALGMSLQCKVGFSARVRAFAFPS